MTPALAKKLNFKPGAKLLYVRTLAEVEKRAGPIVALAKADGIGHMLKKGVHGVRQVAIDATWSAMRFRPKKPVPR